MWQELKNDPLGIFRPLTKLHHNLVLDSAYAAAAENGSTDASSQKQRKCLDLKHKEPKVRPCPLRIFQNCTMSEKPGLICATRDELMSFPLTTCPALVIIYLNAP